MKLLIASDAWHPQVNGVVRSLEQMVRRAPEHGFATALLSVADFRSLPLPGYPEIRLAYAGRERVAARWRAERPSHVHIATEGPVGLAARRHCLAHGLPFTTSYHTRFPEYLAARAPVPEAWSYAYLRRFHGAARGTMVSTASLQGELAARGFGRLMRWTRGVDTERFRPAEPGTPAPAELAGLPGPLFLYVGRLAVEKNVAAFLSLDLPGTKVVVGDGPDRARLQALAPEARFLSAPAPARTSRPSTRPATSSSSRASPTRSASCSWRRWPAASRWRPSRCRAPTTSSAAPGSGCSTRICGSPRWRLCACRAPSAGPRRCAAAGT
ncbi:glycosyltransferase involved in cell wall biosynthesis [Methylobacterium radiotolerans]|uniref:Glycosyltransferase involved in cell wall biosynthesis n=1 Tax=Methylobacterium radiotolerans TaxID=31998 RepID=A0ABV2NJC8_9HYPH